MKQFLILASLCCLLVLLLTGSFPAKTSPQKSTPPNVVLIFMDDMGYGDLGCYGATQYQTPNLDRMASEGIRFTNFLSAQAVCSASRAALLTGCYPNRVGISGALGPRSTVGLNPDETTLAEVLKKQDYATAIFGKWHLGDNPAFFPGKQGFDTYTGLLYSNDMWPVDYDGKPITDETNYRKKSYPTLQLMENDRPLRDITTLEDQATLTGEYTKRAIQFIKKQKQNNTKPFFLYMPHSMTHVPIAASAPFRGKSQQGLYGDVMMEVDWSVGEILKTLKETGIDKNTLVIFTSDNGPWINFGNHAGSTGGLREAKGVSFEGGQRVPCLVRWPGVVPAGRVCTKLSSTIDLLPTIAAACSAKLPEKRIDGISLIPLFKGDFAQTPRREFYYYYRKNNLEAVRRDDWKLVLPHPGRSYEGQLPGKDGFPGKAPEDHPYPLALYDLRRDPGERYDVQAMYPEVLADLQNLVEKARVDLGDDLTNRTGANVRPVGKVADK
ncbi:sulfatase family protein [Spirosoma spitsbergense]|uniref:sulfatase family protein n=1 Tax=Spirosoma spitsbergense TaxID=431554 RepID=UPI00036A17FB|nr:sulfatase [Spirosoma spitsbergense]